MTQKKGFWAILDYWNSLWCLYKFFSGPIFEEKGPFLIKMTSQNDGLLSMDTLLNQNIKIYIVNTMLLFTSYHKQIQTFSKIHSRQIRNRFLSEKWPISQKNDVHVKIEMSFWKLFLKKSYFEIKMTIFIVIFQVVNFDHVYLSGKFWYSRVLNFVEFWRKVKGLFWIPYWINHNMPDHG